MKRILLFLGLCLAGAPVIAAGSTSIGQPVSMKSLLLEMIERDRLPEMQDYRCLHASSYDRSSKTKTDEEGWYANSDRNHWIRIERDRGRREFVMMEDSGPGAIVRWWMTVTSDTFQANPIVRVYIDGNVNPAIEGPMYDILASDLLAGHPLSASEPTARPLDKRGYDLYLPIPYQKSCKVTFESDLINENNPGAPKINKGVFYYNIDYRSYPDGTRVVPFSREDLDSNRDLIGQVCAKMAGRPEELAEGRSISLDCRIPAGKSRKFVLRGEKAIRALTLGVRSEDNLQALRSTVLKIVFDGEQTVWVPVGDFFGIGYTGETTDTWMARVDDSGLMTSLWPMPFRRRCEITVINYGKSPISLSRSSVRISKRKWGDGTMHFGANWVQYNDIEFKEGFHWLDVTLTKLGGEGKYVGTEVMLYNGVPAWWGEGDEKIYVDSETFPSHFGTGSEDYFGYAWSRPERFIHPLFAQPYGGIRHKESAICNTRWRILDAIPFSSDLTFDMEVFQRGNGSVTYSGVGYWYAMPGVKVQPAPDEESVRRPVKM